MTQRLFETSTEARIKIWLDELPEAALVPTEAEWEERVFASGNGDGTRRAVAIEVFRPFGGSFHYGLLGGTLESNGKGSLKVITPCTSPQGLGFAETLACDLDEVIVGGMAEYTSAIHSGVERLGSQELPSGVLNLNCMAHGHIGSARTVFSDLTAAVIRLFIREAEPVSVGDAMAVLGYSGPGK